MSAVARLVLTYFTGTPVLRGITALGVLAALGGSSTLLYLPPLVGGQGLPSQFSLGEEALLMTVPVAGILCLALGASLLSTMFAQLATSHYLYVLPHARAKLCASALATIALVALAAAATITVYYVDTPLPLHVAFERALAVSLLTYTLLYAVLWLTGRSRSAVGLLIGVLAAVAALVLPLHFIAEPSMPLGGLWLASALLWSLFAASLLFGARLRGAVARARRAAAERLSGGTSYRGGRELDFLLGTARPWTLALGQIAPILLATYCLRDLLDAMAPSAPSPWLFFLTILSILPGATASAAATRSRALWLRSHWPRAELLARIERALWRHNGCSLAVLVAMFVGLCVYFGLPTKVLASGSGLLVLGTALSMYLGLLITARIGWPETVLAAAAMLGLMTIAIYAAAPSTPAARIVALEAAFAVAALLLRHLAKRRWTHLDWLLCKPERDMRAPA